MLTDLAPRWSKSPVPTRLRPRRLLLDLPSAIKQFARFDGMRHGLRAGDDGEASVEEAARTREVGFAEAASNHAGTYALSSGYYDAYYGQAQKVRTPISRDFAAAFETVDVFFRRPRPPPPSPSARRSRSFGDVLERHRHHPGQPRRQLCDVRFIGLAARTTFS